MAARNRKTIFHIDVNSAFLSWSAVKRLKEDRDSVDLRTIPSAVAGDIDTRHGVITARSIPAKKYGVLTGEPVVKALTKCPELTIVKPDFATYKRYSAAMMKILKTYTSFVEQASIDEAYLDMTGTESIYTAAEDEDAFPLNVATTLKNEIRNTLGFTVNVGISTNKLLAKMASDFEKPDRIHTLYPEEVEEKLWPLPIERLYGCGEATAEKLRSLGVRTIGDAALIDEAVLQSHLGNKAGAYIVRSANGVSDTEVAQAREDAKGYSNEVTLPHDITTDTYDEEAPAVLHALCEKVAQRLAADEVYAQTIGVQIKTDRFVRHSRQMKLADSTNKTDTIYEIASLLMKRLLFGEQGVFSRNSKIRLIGVSATRLDKGLYRQMSLFDL
ncbi:MAG: DNA polymerase IV [Lachnospiraceae bacterium]|nr:DNA polymerase IV [Lachnospiraceae bacterium]